MSHRRLTILASAVAATLTITSAAQAQFQKGMNLVWWGQTIEPAVLNQSLDNMAAVGVDHLAVNVFWFQNNISSTQVAPNYNLYSPQAATVNQIIDAAHAHGLAVMLRPMVDLSNDPSHWRGEIIGGTSWFNNAGAYGDFVRQMADVAQAHSVEMLSVGAELEATAAQTTNWQSLISSVRSRYSGSLTYGANWGNPAVGSSIAWWNSVDYLGIDAYYPLTNKTNPTFAELQSAWQTRANQIESYRNSVAPTKSVLFTETGYMAYDGTNIAPYSFNSGAPIDETEQADAYRALLSVMTTKPWFAGTYWWAWDAVVDPDVVGYKPEGKLAIDSLASYYVSGYTEGPAWTGGGGSNWSAGANWSSGISPGNLTTAKFTSSGNATPNVNLPAPITVARLVFDQSATAYTIGGSAITFNSGGGVTITDKVTTTQTISAPVQLSGPAVFSVGNAAARLNVNGGISGSNAGSQRLTLMGPGGGSINGSISDGAGVVSIFKSNAGSWTLAGANTYSGSTDIAWGTLTIANNSALGTTAGGTTVMNGASLAISPNLNVAAEPLTISGTGVGGQGALQRIDAGPYTAVTWNGPITLNGSAEIHNRAYNNPASPTNVLVLAGNITGGSASSTLNFRSGNSNPGFFRLTGTGNSYLGNTAISGGKVILAGGDNTLPASTVVTLETYDFGGGVEAGVLDLNGTNQTLAGLTNVARTVLPRVKNDLSGATSTLTINNVSSYTYAGTITNGTGVLAIAKGGTGTQTLTGSNSYTGATTVTGGTLRFERSLLTSSSITVTGGPLQLAQSAGAARVIKTAGVTVSTGAGRLDLANNKMIVTSGDIGVASGGGGAYGGVTGLIQAAYNFGAWDGHGLTTSMPAAADGLTTIAIAVAQDTPYAGGTFAGVSVSASDILVMYTYDGDANLDGAIDGGDYGVIDNFVQVPGAFGYAHGDFNFDGVIDGGDYGIIDNNIQAQGAPFPTSAIAAVPVPEPATTLLLLPLSAGAVLVGRCRRPSRRMIGG